MFQVQNRVFRARFSTFPAPLVLRPEIVVKTWQNYFSIVLTGNDRNCTTNCVDKFRVRNIVIYARFSTLVVPVVARPGKVVKIRLKHFFAVPMRNDTNCIPKSVGMFQALNRVIYTPIFNFTCSGGARARKSRQNSTQTFFSHTDGKR